MPTQRIEAAVASGTILSARSAEDFWYPISVID